MIDKRSIGLLLHRLFPVKTREDLLNMLDDVVLELVMLVHDALFEKIKGRSVTRENLTVGPFQIEKIGSYGDEHIIQISSQMSENRTILINYTLDMNNYFQVTLVKVYEIFDEPVVWFFPYIGIQVNRIVFHTEDSPGIWDNHSFVDHIMFNSHGISKANNKISKGGIHTRTMTVLWLVLLTVTMLSLVTNTEPFVVLGVTFILFLGSIKYWRQNWRLVMMFLLILTITVGGHLVF